MVERIAKTVYQEYMSGDCKNIVVVASNMSLSREIFNLTKFKFDMLQWNRGIAKENKLDITSKIFPYPTIEGKKFNALFLSADNVSSFIGVSADMIITLNSHSFKKEAKENIIAILNEKDDSILYDIKKPVRII